LGIGFFLTNATVERLGGQVELVNWFAQNQQQGACTRLTLPLARLKVPVHD
jgi:sensor histidine kinase regulating citrate/malate metabolism